MSAPPPAPIRIPRRELAFATVAVALLLVYGAIGSRLAPLFAPSGSDATPTPTRPALPIEAPRLPGSIAFAIRGDIYVLREGSYSPRTAEGRNAQPHLTADGELYYSSTDTIEGRRLTNGSSVRAELHYSSIMRAGPGFTDEVVIDGLRARRSDGFHAVSWLLGPAVSPDGRSLAAIEDRGDGAADLIVVDLVSGDLSPVSRGAILADPAWSPDGSMLTVTTYNAEVPGILLWPLDAPAQARRIDDLPDGDAYAPAFHPDGGWIVYTLRLDGRNDLHAYEIETGRDVSLTAEGKSWGAVFSPDGDWVAFLRESGGVVDLYAMELGTALDSGAPLGAIKLTRGEGIDGQSRPSWGP